MQSPSAFLESLRPAGSKRSSKRDLIVNVFLRQEGHLSAEDLADLIRRHDQRISRATVYRTLQWMVDAGIARKVDFGEGRFRFEHSYRHPRHFHLLCKQCNRSFEFLSSDIETLIEEVAAARGFTARQSVLQIYGTCEGCRTGRPSPAGEGVTELVFARDALRVAIATERSGREFYARAARLTRDERGRAVFHRLADEERDHLNRLERRYRELLDQDPELEARPTFLFFKGAANGLFAAGAAELLTGVDARKALLIGIRCERASHRFFKRYGERFEDSEGKRIFLEFADEEREHLDLLMREYRALGPSRPDRAPHRAAGPAE
jgi:Fur family ferric uptake transcriptional regulator